LASLANEKKPELILIGATRNGLELAPRLAERLKTGYVTHAIKMEPDADKEFILIDRLSQEGTTVETQVSRIKPQIVTVTRGTFPKTHANSSRSGTIINVNPEIKNSTTKILKITNSNSILTNPSAVVCVGRAMKTKEDITMVNQFAKTIGAGVAYTRSVGEDFKLASSDQCLGFAGRKVTSKLCITCGISGQSQTIAGFANSQIILSINTDPDARIFSFSDYVVIGDLYKILPKLTTTINRLK
jgi:electron transfer flavoprotein alpha subunit